MCTAIIYATFSHSHLSATGPVCRPPRAHGHAAPANQLQAAPRLERGSHNTLNNHEFLYSVIVPCYSSTSHAYDAPAPHRSCPFPEETPKLKNGMNNQCTSHLEIARSSSVCSVETCG
eukprot:6276444-Prymnesium_polylepis.1